MAVDAGDEAAVRPEGDCCSATEVLLKRAYRRAAGPNGKGLQAEVVVGIADPDEVDICLLADDRISVTKAKGKGAGSHRSVQARSIIDHLGVRGTHPFTQGWNVPQRASSRQTRTRIKARASGGVK